MDDARREGIFLSREIFEGSKEGADSDVLVGFLRPEDHPKGAHLLEPAMRNREAVGIGGDEDAGVLDGPGHQRLVDRVLAEDVDGSDDVPAAAAETLDERTSDVLVGDERETTGHYGLALRRRYSALAASISSTAFSDRRR